MGASKQTVKSEPHLSSTSSLLVAGDKSPERRATWSFPLQLSERKLLLVAADLTLLNGALMASVLLRRDLPLSSITPDRVLRWMTTLSAIWLCLGLLFETYDLQMAARALRSAWKTGWTTMLVCGTYCLVPVLTPVLPQRRMMLVVFPVLAVMGITLWRFAYAHVFVQPAFTRRALIVGAGSAGRAVARAMASAATERGGQQRPELGYRVLGFIDDDPAKQNTRPVDVPVLGTRHELRTVVEVLQPEEIILAIADAHSMHSDLFATLLALQEQGIPLVSMADLYERITGKVPVEHAGRNLHIVLPTHRSPGHRLYLALFRAIELWLASVGCFLLLCLAPLVWLANRLASPGDLFYRQERVGCFGCRFQMLKFRSMVMDAEDESGAVWAAEKDARITPVGAFLRRTRLDELPQLWNVLKGEMSLVGPRPERPHFVRRLSRQIPFYSVRHSVKPGITGWAQVKYCYAASVEDALVKLQYDLYYIKHRSPYLDLKILMMTARVILGLQGR